MTNARPTAIAAAAAAACLLALPAFAQPPRGAGRVSAVDDVAEAPAQSEAPAADVEPQADSLRLTNGRVLRGYVTANDDGSYGVDVAASRGSYLHMDLAAGDVAEVTYAPAAARDALKAKIDWWRNKDAREATERSAYEVEALSDWFGQPKAWRARGRYYSVETDLSAATAREFAWRLDVAYPEYCRLLNRDPGAPAPMSAYVFSEKATFARALGHFGANPAAAHVSGGMFVPQKEVLLVRCELGEIDRRLTAARSTGPASRPVHEIRRLEQWRSREEAHLTRLLYHEGFHAFQYRMFRGEYQYGPHLAWLGEGLAVYFEVCRVGPQGLRTGVVHGEKLRELQELLARDEAVPLRALLTQGFTTHPHPPYPESWGLVYYLETRGTVREHGGWQRFAQGPPAQVVPTFEDVVGQPIDEFEQEWRRYMKNLTP